MSEKVLQLNDTNFDQEIKSGIVLVDFWASWCGPCRIQAPILDEVADKIGTAAKIAKVNVDESPRLASIFGIRSIPTLIIFKDGKQVKQFTGVQKAAILTQELQAAK